MQLGTTVLSSIEAFTSIVSEANLAHIDVDGDSGIPNKLSEEDAETYKKDVADAQRYVRSLEASSQALFDDSSMLFMMAQAANASSNDLPPSLPGLVKSVRTLVAQTCDSVAALLDIQHRQAGSSHAVYFSLGARIPEAHRHAIAANPPVLMQMQADAEDMSMTALSRSELESDRTPLVTTFKNGPSTDPFELSEETDEDMVDMELAFQRGPSRKPADFDATAMFYSSSEADQDDYPETRDSMVRERTISQSTAVASTSDPAPTPSSSSAAIAESSATATNGNLSPPFVDEDDDLGGMY